MEKIKKFNEIFGNEISSNSLAFSLVRDSYEERYSEKSEAEEIMPGRFLEYGSDDNLLTVKFEKATLRLTKVKGFFRVVWKNRETDTPVSSTEIPAEPFEFKNSGDNLSVDNGSIIIHKSGEIEYYSHNGGLLRTDKPPVFLGRKTIQKSSVCRDAKFHGLGERAANFNVKGDRFRFWNHDANGSYGTGADPLYISLPVYISTSLNGGYILIYDNPSDGYVDICKGQETTVEIMFEQGGFEFYFKQGESRDLVSSIGKLTGMPHMPPKWALGFHQSKYSYMTQAEVEELAESFRKNDIPVSAIHLDIDYMNEFRVFTVNSERFPDMRKLSDKLGEYEIKLVGILDPGVKWDTHYQVYKHGLERGSFVNYPDDSTLYAPVWPGFVAYPDFTSSQVREWWGSYYTFFKENGFSGVWHDMNEPSAFTLWGDNSLPKVALHKSGNHGLLHNLYSYFMAEAGHEAMVKINPDERPFLLSRSGWLGSQKYAWVWTGDIETSWQALKQTIPSILNLSMSGMPLCGVDTGGFSGSPSDELFVRWLQMSSFLPFFRVHYAKGTRKREPWEFGYSNLKIIRDFIKQRYTLIPYYYTLAKEAALNGIPIIRPIIWADSGCSDSENTSFMVGDDIIVFPVLEEGVDSISIHLPAGEWYDLRHDTLFDGGMKNVKVSIDSIPVFVRGGAIIPMEKNNSLEIHVYSGEALRGEIYLDDGKPDGEYLFINLTGTSSGNDSTEINIKYSGSTALLGKSMDFVVHGKKFHGYEMDGVRQVSTDTVLSVTPGTKKLRLH
ncbi:MAG: glycoside hydrolase family 31 protein [Candidatus Thermoplasmatota archaeon]|nr:glycoside hydrolase family 31 protein [Candidatus Thermoplasmatota archaeon]